MAYEVLCTVFLYAFLFCIYHFWEVACKKSFIVIHVSFAWKGFLVATLFALVPIDVVCCQIYKFICTLNYRLMEFVDVMKHRDMFVVIREHINMIEIIPEHNTSNILVQENCVLVHTMELNRAEL